MHQAGIALVLVTPPQALGLPVAQLHQLGRLHFGGLPAWLAWMALHVTVLIGFRNRLAVLSSWIYSYVFFRRGSRLITGISAMTIRRPIAPATVDAASAPSAQDR